MTTVRVISEHNGKSVRELRIRRLPGVSTRTMTSCLFLVGTIRFQTCCGPL
jgi:hypothetical protein